MLVGTIGNPRTGKTLLNTIIIVKIINLLLKRGQTITTWNPETGELIKRGQHSYYANYHFLPPYDKYVKFIEPQDLLDINLAELYSGIVVLMELYTWLESRGSGSSSINKILSHVAFQSGKSGFDILWDAQLSSSIDKRIRLLTDYFFCALNPTDKYFRYAYISASKLNKFKISKLQASEYYLFYDTRERMLPIEASELSEKLKNKTQPISPIPQYTSTPLKEEVLEGFNF